MTPTQKEEPQVYTEEKAGWVPPSVWMLWRRKQNLLPSLRIKQRFLGCSAHSLATVLTMQFQLTWLDHKGQKRNATSAALSTMSNWSQRPSQMTTNSSWIPIHTEDVGATASGRSFTFLINLRRLNTLRILLQQRINHLLDIQPHQKHATQAQDYDWWPLTQESTVCKLITVYPKYDRVYTALPAVLVQVTITIQNGHFITETWVKQWCLNINLYRQEKSVAEHSVDLSSHPVMWH